MGNSHANDVQCWLPGVRDRENRRSGTVKRCRGCSRAQKAHQLRIYPWLPRGVPAPSITAFVFFSPRNDFAATGRNREISRDLGAIWGTTERRNFSRFGRDLGTNTRKFETKFGWYVRERQHHPKLSDESMAGVMSDDSADD